MEIEDIIPDDYRTVKLKVPTWASFFYIIIPICLIPWTIYLGYHLPSKHINRYWDISWVGLDASMILSLLVTGILAKYRSIYLILSASITGTLFCCDAWFDILGYRIGTPGSVEAWIMAAFGEIPMAILSFSLAMHGLRRLHGHKS